MNARTDLLVPISVTDDNIDEADEQFFIAQLVAVDDISHRNFAIERDNTNCIIIDNDREL